MPTPILFRLLVPLMAIILSAGAVAYRDYTKPRCYKVTEEDLVLRECIDRNEDGECLKFREISSHARYCESWSEGYMGSKDALPLLFPPMVVTVDGNEHEPEQASIGNQEPL